MAKTRVNSFYFTIEPAVKEYVYARTVIAAFITATTAGAEATEVSMPSLPANEGELQNPLAFPKIFEIDQAGKTVDATAPTWTAYLFQRLLTGGVGASSPDSISTPSLSYNQDLLTYHFEQLGSARKEQEFLGYLRGSLLNKSRELREAKELHQEARGEEAQLLIDTLVWLESFSKQYKSVRLSQKKKGKKYASFKVKNLAYKTLFLYDQILLTNKYDVREQAAYIHQQTGQTEHEIERYLNSNLTEAARSNLRYCIYEIDLFEQALIYIQEIMPDAPVEGFQFREVSKK